ncbi:carbohydrate ABC transporter membrane protein 1 (CUT1 family) [Haloactinopolyspora alba]|uniref:Carbohydrate ABC transporter membrane protein 1 (CUT1 family) n=1 Tax=Haloactinopolyspora alba TaxID=648780 RepID=A0A2P8E6U3_9ACTN|nr:sugar ABC transporter permease [Haloactinopolyspora alba]PSL05147.1 carbohydrate ABC transporter membrane protein 1 (CUT1 family) [Haloactinopolyspora alba]
MTAAPTTVPGTAPGTPAASTARRRRRRRQTWTAYAFVSPAVVLFAIFIVGPFVYAIGLSLYAWDLLTPARFVGLENFSRLFDDPMLAKSLITTFLFALASVVTHIVGGLLLAIGVNRAMNRALSYFVRTAVFFPFLISWAAVSLLWKYVLDPTFGLMTYYLGVIGIDAPSWFSDPTWSLPAIIGIDFWHTIGFTFVILLAGLQTVPNTLVEAARTDGANSLRVFWHVTVPTMSPTLFFATVITFIGAFQIFEPMQIITNGGPDDSTTSIVMYLYENAFQSFQVGYASAIALVVFVVIMTVTVVQFWLSKRWVHEQ